MTRTFPILRRLAALALALALSLSFSALAEEDGVNAQANALLDKWIASVSVEDEEGFNTYLELSPTTAIEWISALLDLGLPPERVSARLEERGIHLEMGLNFDSEGEPLK